MILQASNCLIEKPPLRLINLMAIFLDIIKDSLDMATMKYLKNPIFRSIPPAEPETVEASMPQVQGLRKQILPRVKISPLLVVAQLVRAIIQLLVPDVKMGTRRVDLTWIQITLTELVPITPRVEGIFNPLVFRQITPLVNLEMVGT